MDSLVNIIKLYLRNANKLLSRLRENIAFMYNKQGSLNIMYKSLIDEKLAVNRILSSMYKKLLKDNHNINLEISKFSKSNEVLERKIFRTKELLTERNII